MRILDVESSALVKTKLYKVSHNYKYKASFVFTENAKFGRN